MYFSNPCFQDPGANCNLTKLIQAVNGLDEEVLLTLIRDNRSLINELDSCGWTPLMHAAKNNKLEVVEILYSNGASANVKGLLYCTPLMIAAIHGHADIVKFLVPITADLNAVDIYGNSAFIHAARNGRLKVVDELFSHGVDVTLKDKKGFTAFMCAASEHHQEVVDFFNQHNIHADKRDEKTWKYHREKIMHKNSKEINKLQKRNHTSTENLQNAGCYNSRISSEKTQINLPEPANFQNCIHHEHVSCKGFEQLSNTTERLIKTSGKRKSQNSDNPQDKSQDEETDTPVLRKKSQDKCQIDMLNVRVTSSHITFDEVDEPTCLQFLQPTQQQLHFMGIFQNYKEKFRNEKKPPGKSAASSITSEETCLITDEDLEVVLRNNKTRQSLSSRRQCVYGLNDKVNSKLSVEVNESSPMANRRPILILQFSEKVNTINIHRCENVAAGDRSKIIVNSGK